MEDPRPDQLAREMIGRQIDMTPRSVQIWFQNNRAKVRVQERKHAHLYQLPLTTTNCGGNISRVHFDMEVFNRRQRSRFYFRDEVTGSVPNLSTSYSGSLLGSPDPREYLGRSPSTVYISSQPASPNFESIYSSPEAKSGSEVAEESSNADVIDILNNLEHSDPQNKENFQSLDGLNIGDEDIDGFLSKTIEIQGVQIGSWIRTSHFAGSILLKYIPYQPTFRIFIEESPKSTGYSQRHGGIIIEFELTSISQPSNRLLVLKTENYPFFYQMDAWGSLEPYELDLNERHQFDNGDVKLSGDFSFVDEDLFYVNLRESQVFDPFKPVDELAPNNWSTN